MVATPVSMTFAKGNDAMALGLALLEDGSFVVVGRAETVVGPSSWGWAARVSRDGEILWDRDWTSVGTALFAVTPVTDGGVIAVGETVTVKEANARRGTGLVMKVDEQGSLGWTKTLDLGATTEITAVVEDEAGRAMIGAIVKEGLREPGFVGMTSAAGQILRVIQISENAGWVVALRRMPGAGYLVIGPGLVRVDQTGHPLWRQTGEFRDAAVFPDGTLVAVHLSEHIEMVRFSADGTQLWERSVDDPTICQPVGVWTRGADEIVVLSDPCAGSEFVSVTVLSGRGEKRSVHRLRVGADKRGLAAQLDRSGSVVMAGTTERKGWVFRSEPILGGRE